MVVAFNVTVVFSKKEICISNLVILSDIDNNYKILNIICLFTFSHYLENKSHVVGSFFLVKV